jgi:putative endonuclease
MDRRLRRGRDGEELAARHLEARGWRILARNWRDGPRELDLVAFRAGVLAVVEVKARSGDACGTPLEALTPRKRREIELAAGAWLRAEAERCRGIRFVRFDAVSVYLRPGVPPHVEHLEDAWRRGE